MAGSSTCGNAEIFQVFKALSQTPFVMETILPETQMETLKSGKIQPESRICRRGKGVCRGVVTAFHQNEPVLALKVRVAAHSPPQPPLVQRFVHRCGVGADQGGQDGIPAALVEGTGVVFAVVCISR